MSVITAIIVDDAPEFRALLKTHLKYFHCRVTKEISDGKQVIESIEKMQPDIVFLDINLPEMDGLSVLDALAEKSINNNIWVVSAKDQNEVKDIVINKGAKGYIQKPFTMEKLKQVFDSYNQVQKQKQLENQNMAKSMSSIELTGIIVDDDALMCQLLDQKLRPLGCNIHTYANSGEEAIALLSNSNVPDIVFLDIEMPNGNGMTVLDYIKSKGLSTSVVVVSAHNTVENVKNFVSAGAAAFVVKPYTDEKIKELVKNFQKKLAPNKRLKAS